MVRILIADDHPIFRDGLRRLLEAEPDLSVVGQAVDAAEAIQVGARGVVLKESASAMLLKAIRVVMEGGYGVGRESVSDLMLALRSLGPEPGRPEGTPALSLTP